MDSNPTTRRALAALSTSVAKSRRIVVVTGAGISCSSGIPVRYNSLIFLFPSLTRAKDFRSADGLYAKVKAKYPTVVADGKELFSSIVYSDRTALAAHYAFLAELKVAIDGATPTPTHHFISTLETKGRLLRSYTQNIDGLEERLGLLSTTTESIQAASNKKKKINLKEVRNVQLHGDLNYVKCLACAAQFPFEESHLEEFREGFQPTCSNCVMNGALKGFLSFEKPLTKPLKSKAASGRASEI